RIIGRIFTSNRGRSFVILLALGAGAAVTAALLNLQIDAKRRITTEFRAFGPNVLIVPKGAASTTGETLPESFIRSVPVNLPSGRAAVSAALYLVASVSVPPSGNSTSVVIAGINPLAFVRVSVRFSSASAASPNEPAPSPQPVCVVGARVAQRMGVQQDAELVLANGDHRESCGVASFRETGGPEDDRVEIGLRVAQRLAGLPGRISAIEIIVPGTPGAIQDYIADLQHMLPDAEVRPVRQFTEGEAKIYDRISGILSYTVGLVLVLTALCVMAAMTNVAMERRNDVGLMKAIGGATRRVLRLFLAEAALLGLTGGVLGAALGLLLSIWLGKQVFGVAARPRLIVYPVAVALTMLVSIAGAYPLRRLANIRPASVFRGEA
ncbi:MAG TPA: ABC transporter permease, partial [Bryobacteraceae bacterium]|nr:ABC transporter permease [Bryobacteraceae bacterium]